MEESKSNENQQKTENKADNSDKKVNQENLIEKIEPISVDKTINDQKEPCQARENTNDADGPKTIEEQKSKLSQDTAAKIDPKEPNTENIEKQDENIHSENVNFDDDDDEYEDIDDEDDVNIEDYKLKVENENSISENKDSKVEKKNKNSVKLSSSETENKSESKAIAAFEPTKKGKFYQHDNRDDLNEEPSKNNDSKIDKWHHDKFNPKEKRSSRGGHNRQDRRVNRQDNNTQNQPIVQEKGKNNKGLSLQEYMEQNEGVKNEGINKEQKHQRHFQGPKNSNEDGAKKQNFRRDLNMDSKPTSTSELKTRLDYSTRIPTILDDIISDNRGQYNSQNSGQYRNNYEQSRHNQFNNKKFDKPFDKNEKLDIVITRDFQSSARQVTLNSNNSSRGFNDRRQNDRRQNQNRQEQFTPYIQQQNNYRGSNQRRNFQNTQNNQDNANPFNEYSEYNGY